MSTTAAAALKVLEQDSGGACCGGGGCCGSSAAEAGFGSELYSAAQRDDAFGNHQSSRACRLTRLRLRPSQLPVIVRMTTVGAKHYLPGCARKRCRATQINGTPTAVGSSQ